MLPASAAWLLSLFFLAAVVWIVCLTVQRYLLMLGLLYKGYLFDPHGKPPLKTKLWLMYLKALVGPITPSMYTFQNALPPLPLPSLSDTCKRYLHTVEPLLDKEKFDRMTRLTREFESGLGKKLQRFLWVKWLVSKNYVSDWWEQYVYLRGRSSIMINSNYYLMDAFELPTNRQAARAAAITFQLSRFKHLIEMERIEPLVGHGCVPLCMNQYKRMFGLTRVPGNEQDQLVHVEADKSRHVAVLRRGRFYRLPLVFAGRSLNAAELEKLYEMILEDDNNEEVSTAELHLPAVTAADRTTWAEIRKTHFSAGVNRSSLEVVESAAFIMVLDDGAPVMDINDDESVAVVARYGLHGSGFNRWFDKSVSIAVHSNGCLIGNAEHSWADAPVVGHMIEYMLLNEIVMEDTYDADGHCKGNIVCPLRKPQRLHWELNKPCAEQIEKCVADADKLISDLDLHVMCHTKFGKGAVKKCRVSPDAFIQMALQLAYFRDVGYFSLTYEASMTRLYLQGRTETVRPVSLESCAFVRAMDDPSVTQEQRRALLKAATAKHQDNYRHAMAGNGVDRHLFTLYVVSKYLKEDSPFLNEVLSEPWRLSTSQTPYSQMKLRPDFIKSDNLCAGGGFGPVADDGYGVSYVITGEQKIFFHISSKHSSDVTNSKRFADRIRHAMREMLDLFGVNV